MSIVVDAKGRVSEAKVLSGPAELAPIALASVKMWRYEPPVAAPVTRRVAIAWGSRECPGPDSDRGEVKGNGRLFDKNGKLAAVVTDEDYPLPRYPEAERQVGVAGTMILSVKLEADGYVKEIHAAKSLSPNLDQAAMDAVRPVRFRRVTRNPSAPSEELWIKFIFRAACSF